MTEDTTEDMTDMKNMIIATGGDHLHHIIVVTDQDQDLVPTVQGVIKKRSQLQSKYHFSTACCDPSFSCWFPAIILYPIKMFLVKMYFLLKYPFSSLLTVIFQV
ncbi:hypothetical protein L345_05344 [Ophiophagus hannah]|uniref:Uncharacterized protein n=1 Tax=Ophiophagus hannah TaxID=8665 RepID=V8P2V2_OPHHA|nr:hypothetical protein L345_05344 [Ophiophagus hannah]